MRYLNYLLLTLTVLALTAQAEEKPRAWNEFLRAIHSARELAERPQLAQLDSFTGKLRSDIDWLNGNEFQFKELMEFVSGPGILETDQIREDLSAIYQLTSTQVTDAATAKATRDRLRAVGYHKLAVNMANFLTGEQLGDAQAAFGLESTGERSAAPTPPKKGKLEDILRHVTAFEKNAYDLVDSQDKYHAAAEKAGRRLFRLNSLATSALTIIGGAAGATALGYWPHSDREYIGLLFGLWTANHASFYSLWQYTGWDEWYAKRRAPVEYRGMVEEWTDLLKISPEVAPGLAAAAARDKSASTDTIAGNEEEAALDALLLNKSPETTKLLLELALRSLEKNKEDRAKRILAEVSHRKNEPEFAVLSDRINAVIHYKRNLEWVLFTLQTISTAIRVAVLGVVLYYANDLAGQFIPQWGTRWRAVVLVVAGYIQSRSILGFLWQTPGRWWADALTSVERRRLTQAFRDLLKVDKKGDIVARLVQYRVHETSRELVLESALTALSETPSGEVTKTLLGMMKQLLAEKRGLEQTKQARRLIKITAEQYRSCVRNFGSLVKAY